MYNQYFLLLHWPFSFGLLCLIFKISLTSKCHHDVGISLRMGLSSQRPPNPNPIYMLMSLYHPSVCFGLLFGYLVGISLNMSKSEFLTSSQILVYPQSRLSLTGHLNLVSQVKHLRFIIPLTTTTHTDSISNSCELFHKNVCRLGWYLPTINAVMC